MYKKKNEKSNRTMKNIKTKLKPKRNYKKKIELNNEIQKINKFFF